MGYQPNIVSKGDIIEINATQFVSKTDVNYTPGHKLLILQLLEPKHIKTGKVVKSEAKDSRIFKFPHDTK